jgi:hypothetical protein
MDSGFAVILFIMGVVSGILLASKIEDLKGDGVPFVPWI